MQPSSANISQNNITGCSETVDATGHYIWRENGAEGGRCCGIDFQQAAQKRDNCTRSDPVCVGASIELYEPFAYDAVIAMAHGLHKLFYDDGIDADKISADLLFRAIRQSTFKGVSGNVAFLDNGDRQPSDLQFVVKNYHAATRNFQDVGHIAKGSFTPCEHAHCRMIFSDGSNSIPSAQPGVCNT